MTLLDLAFKNVKSNLKNYLLYFVSTISSITIYFIFLSLKYAPTTLLSVEASSKIASAIASVSFVIIVFIGVFIAMTNAFFVRSRKKEIGVYIFSGMHQAHVAWLLFIENILIGLFSITIGIGLGLLFSKLATMLLVKMMGMDEIIHFFVAPRAVYETLGAFSFIFILTSLSSAFMAYRFKVIELIQASKSEDRAPKHSTLKGIIGLVLVLAGYGLSQLIPYSGGSILLAMLATLALTILGTYFLFSAFSVMVLNALRKKPAFIFKGVNILSINHLMFRIQNNARAMATIAVLSATTISIMGTSLTMIQEIEMLSTMVSPNSLQVTSPITLKNKIDAYVTAQLNQYQLATQYDLSLTKLPVDGRITDESSKKPEPMNRDRNYFLISQSEYNVMAEKSGHKNERIDAPIQEGTTVALQLPFEDRFYETVNNMDTLVYDIKLSENSTDTVKLISSERRMNTVIPCRLYNRMLVVSDAFFAKATQSISKTAQSVRVINVTDTLKTKAFFSKLKEDLSSSELESINSVAIADLQSELKLNKGVNLFITLFVCLIFVMASGSVIYFKQLTDAVGEVQKYQTLYKLGIHSEEIKKTVSQQLLFMFGAPYLVAVCHSVFALSALAGLLHSNLMWIGITACSVYLILYIGFYLGTKRSYLRIIWPMGNGK